MQNRFEFTRKNKKNGTVENVGYAQLDQTDERATLYLYGDIVSTTWQSMWYADDKCPQDIADFLNQIDNDKEIDVYFNSGGGDVFAGIAICSILRRHAGKIVGYIDGIAASIASAILCACDEVYRNTGAQVMVHKPWSYAMGNADDFRKNADDLDMCEESMLDIYMTKAKENVSREDIQVLLKKESWLSDDMFNYFEFQQSDTVAAQACISTYFDKYANVPTGLNVESKDVDKDAIVDAVVATLNAQSAQNEESRNRTLRASISLFGG